MKKHFAFLLCLIMMLSLISCHTNSQNAQETTATTETDSSANNVAMQMYEAAIKEEISVYDERLGEVKLKGLRFTNNDTELAERESNRIARRRCIFASFGVLSLARLISCFAKSHQNLSKMHSPAGASSFDVADLFESKSFSRRAYRQYVQGERCRNRRNLHVKTNLVRLPFG